MKKYSLIICALLVGCNKAPPNSPIKDLQNDKPTRVAEYVHHQCDAFGRAIYITTTHDSIFVIDNAPECKGHQPTSSTG
jgi:hypothetical protein